MKRREAREMILQILYQMDVTKVQPTESINSVLEDKEISEEEYHFIENIVRGTYDHLQEIDGVISKYLKGWTLSRLPYVDRAIIRIATYELIITDEASINVILNEAVELAKIFGTDESAKFVNGVLGALVKDQAVITERK